MILHWTLLAGLALAAPAAPAPGLPTTPSSSVGVPGELFEPGLPAPGERLTAFGLELSAGPGGLRVDHVLAGSEASGLGLAPGDLLLDVCGAEARDLPAVAKALAEFRAETRRWAVVRRGGAVVTLASELPPVRLAAARSPDSLSPLEEELARKHLEEAGALGPEAARRLPTPRLDVGAGQRTWIRFPSGLGPDAKAGDVVEGLTATGLAADADLDYLAIPPRSQAWAEIVETSSKDGVRAVRLHLFKLKLAGGHSYAVSARVTDHAGAGKLTAVSPGGTVVTAEPASLGPDARWQIEFLEPFSLYETPAYYRAGVGLWLKSRASDGALEVSHVIAGRSADKAGVRVGDVLYSAGSAYAAKLDFVDALDRLYGPPGSKLEVRVQRGSTLLAGAMELTRGVRYDASTGIEVDWTAKGPGLLVGAVAPDSPAAKAGVRPGDRLARFGSLAAEDYPADTVREMLKRELKQENAITLVTQDGVERALALDGSWTRVPVAPPYKQ